MITRDAKPHDIPQIIDLAVESVSRSKWPVKISVERMTEEAKACLGPAHFMRVTEIDGKVVACVAAQTSAGWWFERGQSLVLLFYSRVRGAGIPLLREYARWVKSRPYIKMAIFSLEHDADPRIALLLKRLGFGLSCPQAVYVRGLECPKP